MIKRLVIFIFFLQTLSTYSASIYVDQSAAANGDGSSWVLAFRDIQSAVDAASANDIIFIAEGLYKPESEIDITFPLTIRGGYPQGGGTQNIPAHIAQIQADFDPSNFLYRVFDIAANAETSIEGLRFYNVRLAINTRSSLILNAIQFYGSTNNDINTAGTFDNLTVNNCLFSNNSGTSLSIGSSIINTINVDSCIFQNGTNRIVSANDDANIFNIADCIIKDYVSTGTLVSINSANTTLTNVTVTNNNANVFSFDENITTINGMVAKNNIESRLIYHREGTLNVNNSTFTENIGDNAVCIQSSNAILLNVENSSFYNNTSTDGGVAVLRSSRSNTNLINSKFNSNNSEGTFNNAVMDLTGNENVDILINIDGCEFKNNVSEGNAALEIEYYLDLIINNSLFENNGTNDSEDLDLWYLDSAIITNNTFKNNTSDETVINIGYMYVDAALIENNVFINNTAREINVDRVQDYTARNNKYYGDNIKVEIDRSASSLLYNEYFEGNITNNEFIEINESVVTLSNSTLISTRPSGTHLVIDSGNDTSLRILNTTISAQNYADTHVRVGFDDDLPSWIRNSIIWSGSDLAQSALAGGTSNLTVRYSLIKSEEPAGAGNINGNFNANRPRFSDPSDLDFRHRLCSPTVNAGNNSYNSETLDILGNPRIFESTIDMGCYELQEPESASCAALDRPLCTALTSPLDGDVNVVLDTHLSWLPDPNAIGYILRVGTALGTFDILNETLGNVTSYNLSNDLPQGSEIFVRIIPFNGAGNALSCASESFNTESIAVVSDTSCNNLTSPLDTTTNVSTDSDISWTQDPNAEGYLLTVGTTSGGTDILNNFDVGNDTTYDFPFELPETTEIFVTVIPYNVVGNATGCNEESFTTDIAILTTDPFITTWKTDNVGISNDNQITIPTTGTGYNYTVNWGDGNTTTGETGDATHTYATIGTYTVSISGDFPRIHFDNGFDKEKILTIQQWGDNPWTTMESAFYGCTNLNITNPSIDEPDLSNVTDLDLMFQGCSSFNGDVTNWDVSTIDTMRSLFREATVFNQDIGDWNVSNVQYLSRTFSNAIAFNQDISTWDVSNVTNMLLAFYNAESFNQPIQAWNVENVLTFARIFEETEVFNQPIGVWDTSSATNISGVFNDAVAFNQDLSNWDVSNVTLFRNTFEGAIIFNQDLSAWDTSSATDMLFMFRNAIAFNQDISNWNVSQVYRTFAMFENATAFDQDLSSWNVESITTAERMFDGVTLSTENYDALLIGWNAQNLQPNVIFSGGNSQYCLAEPDRTNMINTDLWVITDGGSASDSNAILDAVADVTSQNSYTLPAITGTNLTGNESYFTEANGNGIEYNAGDIIQFADFPSYPITLYIFDTSVCNSSEIQFQLIITESSVPNCTTIDNPDDGENNVSVATNIFWDDIANADGYILTVGTTPGGNDIVDNEDVGDILTYDFLTDLPENTEIFINIVPYNSVGNATGCAEESFTTETLTLTNPFITTWETTTANETITIPTRTTTFTYDYTIDWGDGTTNTSVTGDITHTYAIAGIHSIEISGKFPQIHFNGDAVDRDKILTIEQWGEIEWLALTQAFKGCNNLTITNPSIDVPNLSNVTNASEAFRDATLFNGDISAWDVSTVTNMLRLFNNASSFNQDIGNWNVSNVVTMTRLFEGATVFNQDIGNWNTNNVTSMAVMFTNATSFNQYIGNWNVSNVTDMNTMFGIATSFNQDIGNWDVGNVINMNQMFYVASAFNQDLSAWNVSQVNSMIVMFFNATSFDQNIGGWDVTNVTNATNMFSGVTLSVANYEALLIGWDSQNLQPNVPFSGGNSTYCSQEAQDAKANMIATDGWTITDGGLSASPTFDAVANVTIADSYTLPAISGSDFSGNELYYTGPNGTGTSFMAGETIVFADFPSYPVTLYIYDATPCLTSEVSFELTITVSTIPNCTTLTVPLNGATDVSITTDLTWSAITNVDGYFITIGTTSGGNDILDNFDVGNFTTYDLPADLPDNTEIFVTIIPYNGIGNATGCSEESFITETVNTSLAFITTWKTDNPGVSDPNQITIPTFTGETYNYDVDWGDGTNTSGETGNATHTYTTQGSYTVSITGLFPRLFFDNDGDREKLLTIEQWGDNPWTSMVSAFEGCTNVIGNFTDSPDLSNVTSMANMFDKCRNYNSDMDDWDVSTITIMSNMFIGADAFNGDIETWNTSNVTSMERMFANTIIFNRNIGNWNTSNLINMSQMFFGAQAFNQNINFKPGMGIPFGDAWDTSNVTDMEGAFWNASVFNSPIGDWNTSSVEDMSNMFFGASLFNQDIGSWDVTNVQFMHRIFILAPAFNQDIGAWVVDNVETFYEMFSGASAFNQDIGSWNIDNATDLNQMFANALSFNQDISGWNTSNVTNMAAMFSNAGAFDQNLGAWNVESVTNAAIMFNFVTLSTANYDALLIDWNAQNLQPNVIFSGGNSQYCEGASARANMINGAGDNWTITDGGLATGPTVDDLADQTHVDAYTLPVITGTQLTGNEAYYTEPNGGGTQYNIGDTIDFGDFPSYPITLYIYDGSGACADEELFELILTSSGGTVPNCTTLTAPLNSATDVSIGTDFTWTAITNADGYFITIGTTSGGNDILDNFDVGNFTTYDLALNLPETTGIFVTIIPYNEVGDAIGCTEESFTTETLQNLPGCTALTTPLNGATNVPVDTNLTWDAAPDATGYIIAIGTSSEGSEILFNLYVGNTLTYNPPTDLPANTEIFVRILPSNSFGNNPTGCVEESFITGPAVEIPNCTNLVMPLNSATDVSIITDLSWNAVTDAIGYLLTVGTTSGGNDILDNFDVGNFTTYDLPIDLLGNTEIFVTIIPYNAIGNASGCVEESFTTVLPQPICVNLISPFFQETNVPVNTDLTWDVSQYASGYSIAIGTATGLDDILTVTDVGNITTYDIPFDLPENTTVYVTIIAYNASGSIVCGDDQFTTEAVATIPSCTNITLPIGGSEDVSVSTDISWAEVSNANGYLLTVGTTSGGSDIFNNIDVGSMTTYDFSTNLPDNTTIYVSIIPYNGVGEAIGCTEESFTTETVVTVPGCTILALPMDGETDVSVSTDLSWMPISIADGYLLNVGTTPGGTDILNAEDVGNITIYDLPNDLPDNTIIYVTVIPYNAFGNATGCQEESFTTGSSTIVLDCTTLTMPLAGETNVSVSTNFSWEAVDNANGYIISIGTNTVLLDGADVGNVLTYDMPFDLPENTEIIVQISPYLVANETIGCASEWFTTGAAPTVPDCTSLASPLNGATNVLISVDLNWNAVTDAEGYRLSVGTSSGGNDILNNVDAGNVTSYDLPTDLPSNTIIFVSIIPYNNQGDTTGCIEESFTTENTDIIPICTRLISPLDVAINVSPETDLTWVTEPDANGYRLSIGTTTNGTDILDNLDVGNVTTYDLPSNLPDNTQIFVNILPYNSRGEPSGCLEESFTTGIVPILPECTLLQSPLHTSINVSVETDLAWQPSAEATGYILIVGTFSGGTDIVDNLDVGNTTTYDLPFDLQESTEILVRIIPYNNSGFAESCEEEGFTTGINSMLPQTDDTKYGFSPDGNGINDYWVIVGIENYLDNEVTIFNRWGDIVFKIKGYDNVSRVFRGDANQKTNMGAGKLPSGTYFFDIQINGDHSLKKTQGYVIIKR